MRRLGQQAGELLVVDHHLGTLALEHVDQLGARERRVEQQDVGAQLGRGDAGVDEAAVVAAHHRHAVALADAACGQSPSQGVGAPVQLAPGQRALLVDQPDAPRAPASPWR